MGKTRKRVDKRDKYRKDDDEATRKKIMDYKRKKKENA